MNALDYKPTLMPWTVNEADMPSGNRRARLLHLVRYAVLAPSTHNTQPWRFEVFDDTIRLFMDETRWLAVADADQREIHISAGCALENLLIAAEHYGYRCNVKLLPDERDHSLMAELSFAENGAATGAADARYRAGLRAGLFDFLTLRVTNHRVFDGRPVAQDALRELQSVCVEPGLRLMLLSDPSSRHRIDDLVMRADAVQFADPAFRAELGHWLGQGAFGETWFMAKLSQMAMRLVNMGERVAKRDSAAMMSAPVFGAIVADNLEEKEVPRLQVMAGQMYERVQLMATRLGLSMQPMNQVLQQRYFKAALMDVLFGTKETVMAVHQVETPPAPQMLFRLGHSEPEPQHTPRRDLAEMVV